MRAVILEMFQRTNENNDSHYLTIFHAAFGEKAPQFFKNVPTFTENEYLPDMIKFHFLNEEGGLVINIINK